MPQKSIEYLLAKRQTVLKELHSDEHYNNTETIVYGEADPFSVFLAACDSCGDSGQMQKRKASSGGVRWLVVCKGCGRCARENRKRPWQAALAWNEINLGSQTVADFPLFGLASLSPEAVTRRLSGIRRDLELRRSLAGIEREIARRAPEQCSMPGIRYQERLDAYLKWSMLGLRLAKVAAGNQPQ